MQARLIGLRVLVCAAAALALATPLWAGSNIIASSTGYQATDRLTAVSPNGFDVSGNLAALYADGHLKLYNRSTWQAVADLGNASYDPGVTRYNSFVKFGPSGESVWVGYTEGGNADDRIYQVTGLDATPAWNYMATLPANYDLAFSGTTPYVSGLNSSVWGGPNAIWRLDTSGMNEPTKIADVGGFAAGIAFDAAGNLYYGTSFGSNDKLVEFTARQVSEGGKSFADAAVLSNLPYSATSVSVDAAGHVLFTANQMDDKYNELASTLGIWNGTAGNGNNYQVVGDGGANHWYNAARTVGDVRAAGAAFVSDWNNPGVAEVRHLMPGDANGDGVVDINDLNKVLVNCDRSGMAWIDGDFNGDSRVDINDLNVVLTNYDAHAASRAHAAVVPEPSSLALLAFAVASIAVLRRGRDVGSRM